MRRYEIILKHDVSNTYNVDAEDDSTLLSMWATDKIQKTATLIKQDTTKTRIVHWKQLPKSKWINDIPDNKTIPDIEEKEDA